MTPSGVRGDEIYDAFLDPAGGVFAGDEAGPYAAVDGVYDLLEEQIPPEELSHYIDGSPIPNDYAGVLRFARNLEHGADRFALAWLSHRWRNSSISNRIEAEARAPDRLRVDILMHSAGLMLGREECSVRESFALCDAAAYAILAMRAGFEPRVVVDVFVRHGNTVEGFFGGGLMTSGQILRGDAAHLVAMAQRIQAEHFRRAGDYRRAAVLELEGGDVLARVIPGDTVFEHYSRASADAGHLGRGARALHASIEQRLAAGFPPDSALIASAGLGMAAAGAVSCQPLPALLPRLV